MEPATTLQLGFLKIPTLAMGIAGSAAVHATMLFAFNTVWFNDIPVTQRSAETAFAQGQSIQVRLKTTDQSRLEPVDSTPTSRLLMQVAEPQDTFEIEIARFPRQGAVLPAMLAAAELTLPVTVTSLAETLSSTFVARALLTEHRETEAIPDRTEITLTRSNILICTTMDILDPSLPQLPEQPVGVKHGAESLRLTQPIYPPRSIRLGQEGTVIVEVEVLANGRIGDVRLRTSSGFRLLDEAALKAARKGRYKPARRDDRAVNSIVVIPFEFHLK